VPRATPIHKRRNRILVGSAVAVVVLTVAGVIGYVTRHKDDKSPAPSANSKALNPLSHPTIDPSALPADGPPEPAEPMHQTSYCTEVGVLPGTDFGVPPKYLGLLNLPVAWQFGRGAGVKVAVIDTGVTPHPRLPHLIPGGDYVLEGGDGLSDCDAHGTLVTSMIAAAPSPADAFTGVAPDVDLISIRQSSQAFGLKNPSAGGDPQTQQELDSIHTLARAIVHAANMGAAVINISDVMCMSTRRILDQRELGAAVRYAAVDKNAVIIAAAGDTTRRFCTANPIHGPFAFDEARDWSGVATLVTPDWFAEYVLTVGSVDATGMPLGNTSLPGPWVSVAAPGTDLVGLSPRDDRLTNAVVGPGNTLLVPAGTSFSAPLVSGVAALVRAKFPQLTSRQVINRLVRTARPPAGGPDDQIGFGVIDPVAALTRDVPAGR
jgi:type VII secretion-associated serine protease mycosin